MTYPVGTKVVIKLDSRGGEAEGEVLFSSSLFMKAKITSDGPLKGREMTVSPEALIRVEEA